MAVATDKDSRRRTLRFASFDELAAELDRLAASPVRQLGNWTLGQICRHLAVSFNSSIDGYAFRAPWLVRTLGPLLKGRYLRKPMPSGFKLPQYAQKSLLPPAVDDAEGVNELRGAIARQMRESHRAPSPIFGAMTRDEWTQLHLRHAELHLSFVEPL
ncbi:MAG: DUF1569 domain-containing protein [Planctomycetaceae bacterium]|nr:DUF1569 domain-containing protein [Planctomycetaceae bacterium]